MNHLAEMYKGLAKVLVNDLYLTLTEEQFISLVMHNSHGSGEPKQIREIYYKLIKESGKVYR